jgi:hypothetical protein
MSVSWLGGPGNDFDLVEKCLRRLESERSENRLI